METKFDSSINWEKEVRFHQVQIGEHFHKGISRDPRPASFDYNKPKWFVYRKIDKSTAVIVETPGHHTTRHNGYTEKFSSVSKVVIS